MSAYTQLQEKMIQAQATWLVTGAAGFIGSNLVEHLLSLNQNVRGLDNFATGHKRNLDQVKANLPAAQWNRFQFVEGDIQDLEGCQKACTGVDYVLHQAALGSVPRSIEDPLASHNTNVTGFLNMLLAARPAKVKRFVYASSSSVYGDSPILPKREDQIGQALSPYAATKYANELYASVFQRCYGLSTVGLRYFNVFGPRQDPNGPYAAVIPKWTQGLMQGQTIYINGDGETSRDFCYVSNVVQANLLAATQPGASTNAPVYNVALQDRTSLNQLYQLLRDGLAPHFPALRESKPVYRDFRPGDVRHSEADISKARHELGYEPTHNLEQGLKDSLDWYRTHL